MKPVILLSEARLEAIDAFRWYEEQQDGLGRRFRAALGATIMRVRQNPLAYVEVRRGMRRAPEFVPAIS